MNMAFVGGLFDGIKNWFENFFMYIASFIPKTFYLLCTLIFAILDIIQMVFRKAVGLDVLYMTSHTMSDNAEIIQGDLVSNLIGRTLNGEIPILTNVFTSMLILGAILLILTTIVAIMRSEYIAEDSKTASKARILGKSVKSIFTFIIVPMVCYFGLILGNAILNALDQITTSASTMDAETAQYFEASPVNVQAGQKVTQPKRDENGEIIYDENGQPEMEEVMSEVTVLSTSYRHVGFWGISYSGTNAVPLSGQAFRAAAYKANRFRFDNEFKAAFTNGNTGLVSDSGAINIKAMKDNETGADFIDECFTNTYKLKTKNVKIDQSMFLSGGSADYKYVWKQSSGVFGAGVSQTSFYFDKYKVGLVWYFYDLFSFDFIMCLGVLITMTMTMINIIFAMMKRMYELIMLFLVAPPIAAIMPLDNGEALKNWRKKFIGKAISAYSAVVVMNLFFVIQPVLSTIAWFNMPLADYFINAVVTLVGLVTVKDMSATLSEIIGAEDSIAVGEKMQKDVGAKAAGMAKLGMAAAGMAVGGVGAAAKLAKGIGRAVETGKSRKLAKSGDFLKKQEYKDENGNVISKWEDLSSKQKSEALAKARQEREEARNEKAYNKKYGEEDGFKKEIDKEKQSYNQGGEGYNAAVNAYNEKFGIGAFEKLQKEDANAAQEYIKQQRDKAVANKQKAMRDEGDSFRRQNVLSRTMVSSGIAAKMQRSGMGDVIGGVGSAMGGLAKRMGAMGTHALHGTFGGTDLYKSWKENGGNVSYQAFAGKSHKEMEVAKMEKDSYKSEKARGNAGNKIRNEQAAAINSWCATRGYDSSNSYYRKQACKALGIAQDPLGPQPADDGYRPPKK